MTRARGWPALVAGACLALGCWQELAAGARGAGDDLSRQLALLMATGEDELWLSQLGLYADVADASSAPGLLPYAPRFALWSDGAEKRRWLRLPAGTQIDASAMDDWRFPVGTLAFKEFVRDGRRIETRLIARTGPGPRDYWMGAFVWNADESDARFAPQGERDARGSQHDVPSAATCGVCHDGVPGRLLGVAAVQEPNLPDSLVSAALPRRVLPLAPDAAVAALGYLHANCAHCHNPNGAAWPDTDLDLRLSLGDRDADATRAVQSAVSRPLQRRTAGPERLRIAPGAPEQSGLWQRMRQRGNAAQMPPLATERVDVEGLELVAAWIASLAAAEPPARGVARRHALNATPRASSAAQTPQR